MSETPSGDPIAYIAERETQEYDDVVSRADYAVRGALSFYRFRRVGGSTSSVEFLTDMGTSGPFGIHYMSDHPPVRIFNLSVIALLVLFESAANAYFFAQQNAFGLSGGLFQAAAVSLANVATAYFIIGFWGLRHITMPLGRILPRKERDPDTGEERTNYFPASGRRLFIKSFGFFAILFGLMMVVLVNLSAAHYRNILDVNAIIEEQDRANASVGSMIGSVMTSDAPQAIEGEIANEELESYPNDDPETKEVREGDCIENGFMRSYCADDHLLGPILINEQSCRAVFRSDIGQTIGSAATNAMCRPLALHSLDAMVLFALGLAIAALAAFEGRRADAAYPGLSDAARQFQRTRLDLQDALEEYYETYDEWVDDAKKIMSSHSEEMTLEQEVRLRKLLDDRVEPYRRLLETSPEVLRDEFAVPAEAVTRVTGRDCEPPRRTSQFEA